MKMSKKLRELEMDLEEQELNWAEDLADKITQAFKEAKGELADFTRRLVGLVAVEGNNPKVVSEAMRIFEEEAKDIFLESKTKRKIEGYSFRAMGRNFVSPDKMEMDVGHFLKDRRIFLESFRLTQNPGGHEWEKEKIIGLSLFTYKEGNTTFHDEKIILIQNSRGNIIEVIRRIKNE